MKKLTVILTAVLLTAMSLRVFAGGMYTPVMSDTEDVETVSKMTAADCKAAILIEASTGTVLFEQSADAELPPASVTKIMTMLLIVEEIESGRIKLEDTVTASTAASQMGGSQVYLRENEQMTVNEMLKAIAVASANDASFAMAEHISGSEEAFVEKMNAKASELGMTHTHFVNCCGLDIDGHYSSARDIAIMSAELLSHDLIREYCTIWTDSLRGGTFSLVNTNKLVRYYEGATGLKTGSTDNAKNCLSASAKRNDIELIAVILGAETSDIRFDEAKKLLNYGFANYELYTSDTVLKNDTVKVIKGVEKTVKVKIDGKVTAVIPKGQKGNIQKTVAVSESVEAPVEKNQTVGTVTYTLDGENLGTVRVITESEVKRADFWYYFGLMWRAIAG